MSDIKIFNLQKIKPFHIRIITSEDIIKSSSSYECEISFHLKTHDKTIYDNLNVKFILTTTRLSKKNERDSINVVSGYIHDVKTNVNDLNKLNNILLSMKEVIYGNKNRNTLSVSLMGDESKKKYKYKLGFIAIIELINSISSRKLKLY